MPFFDLPALDIIYLVTYWSNKWEFSSLMGFPGGSDGKESACNAGDLGSIPGLGRSPGGGHGSPLQYSFLEMQIILKRFKNKKSPVKVRAQSVWH